MVRDVDVDVVAEELDEGGVVAVDLLVVVMRDEEGKKEKEKDKR